MARDDYFVIVYQLMKYLYELSEPSDFLFALGPDPAGGIMPGTQRMGRTHMIPDRVLPFTYS